MTLPITFWERSVAIFFFISDYIFFYDFILQLMLLRTIFSVLHKNDIIYVVATSNPSHFVSFWKSLLLGYLRIWSVVTSGHDVIARVSYLCSQK